MSVVPVAPVRVALSPIYTDSCDSHARPLRKIDCVHRSLTVLHDEQKRHLKVMTRILKNCAKLAEV